MKSQHERLILNDITSNDNGTHGSVYSNSVASTILMLMKDTYGDSTPTDTQFDESYTNCLTFLGSLSVDAFFTPETINNPTNVALKAEISAQLSSLVAFIINRTQEPISVDFDVVTHCSMDEHGVFHEVILELPLRTVLPLVLSATLNDAKYAHQYEGTPDEKLCQAQADRPARLVTLFHCLQRVRDGICHTGVRHELVSLLNKTYEGVDILEDAAASVTYFLKDYINRRFWAVFHALPSDGEAKRSMLAAMFTWMTERDPSAILALIDPDNDIKKELESLFIKHGSNPETLTVKYEGEQMVLQTYIARLATRLDFACDVKRYPVFDMINTLLNVDVDYDVSLIQQQALIKLQAWIRTTFIFPSEEHNKIVANFYVIYRADCSLSKFKSLLLFSGTMTEESIDEMLALCNNYYEQFNDATDTLPTLPEEQVNAIAELDQMIKKCKHDNMYEKIGNFFALWFVSIKNKSRKEINQLYTMLLDTHFHAKISWPDEMMSAFQQKHIVVEEGQAFRDITPYEINRLFLNAILQKPHDWTSQFMATFEMILSFLSAQLSKPGLLMHSLQRDSYPQVLMEQLYYLRDVRRYLDNHSEQVTKPIKPVKRIVLLEDISSFRDWDIVQNFLDDKQHEAVYQRIKVFLKPIFINYACKKYPHTEIWFLDKLGHVLLSLTTTQRLPFLISIKESFKYIFYDYVIFRLIKSYRWLSSEEMQLLISSFTDELYASWIDKDSDSMKNILLIMPEERRNRFLYTFVQKGTIFDYKVEDIKTYGTDVLYFLPYDWFSSFLERLDAKEMIASLQCHGLGLSFFLSKSTYLSLLLKKLGISNLENTLQQIWEEKDHDKCRDYLGKIVDILPEYQYISFFSALGNRKISNMMASSKDLASILNRVPQEERETLLLAIRLAHIGGEIKDGFDLSLALGGLSIERYADNLAKLENEKFCEIMMKKDMMQKDGLQKLLNFLSEEQCVAFVLALNSKQLDTITPSRFSNIGTILTYLPINQYETFLTRLDIKKFDTIMQIDFIQNNLGTILPPSKISALLSIREDETINRLMLSYEVIHFAYRNRTEFDSALLALVKARHGKSWIDGDDLCDPRKDFHEEDAKIVKLIVVLIGEAMMELLPIGLLFTPEKKKLFPTHNVDSSLILKFIEAGGDIEIAIAFIREYCLVVGEVELELKRRINEMMNEEREAMNEERQKGRDKLRTDFLIKLWTYFASSMNLTVTTDEMRLERLGVALRDEIVLHTVGEPDNIIEFFSKFSANIITHQQVLLVFKKLLLMLQNQKLLLRLQQLQDEELELMTKAESIITVPVIEDTGEIMTEPKNKDQPLESVDNSSSKAAGRRDLYCQQPLKIQESISQFIVSAENALNFLDTYAAGDAVSAALAIVRRDLLKLRDKLQTDATIERPFILSNNEKNSVQIISNNIRLLKTNHFEGRVDQEKYISILRYILNGFTYVFTLGQMTNRNLIAEKTIGRSFFFQHSKTEDETAAINKNIGSLLNVTESLSQLLEFEEDTCKNGNL